MISKIEKVNKQICNKLAHCGLHDFILLLKNTPRYNLINKDGYQEEINQIYNTTIYNAKHFKKNNYQIDVEYTYGKNHTKGRMYALNYGIQKINREIRGCLLDNLYYDLDMINCHPTLLLNICNELNIERTHLINYVKNRDKILSEFSERDKIPKSQCKMLFLKALNTDYVNTNLDKRRKIKYPFYHLFDSEIIKIIEELKKKLSSII